MLVGAAGLERTNAATKSRAEWHICATFGAERRSYPHNKINDVRNRCGSEGPIPNEPIRTCERRLSTVGLESPFSTVVPVGQAAEPAG